MGIVIAVAAVAGVPVGSCSLTILGTEENAVSLCCHCGGDGEVGVVVATDVSLSETVSTDDSLVDVDGDLVAAAPSSPGEPAVEIGNELWLTIFHRPLLLLLRPSRT